MKRERFLFFISSLLSKICINRTVGFRRSKRQSWFTHRELHLGTKILAFRQTPKGREFSYLCYFYPKGHLLAWDLLRGCERTEFRNFGDCFWIIRVEFFRLFLDNPGLVFGTVLG